MCCDWWSLTVVVDTVGRGIRVTFPVTHDLQRDTALRLPVVRVIFFFRRVLHYGRWLRGEGCPRQGEPRLRCQERIRPRLRSHLEIPQHNDDHAGGERAYP